MKSRFMGELEPKREKKENIAERREMYKQQGGEGHNGVTRPLKEEWGTGRVEGMMRRIQEVKTLNKHSHKARRGRKNCGEKQKEKRMSLKGKNTIIYK